MKRLPTVIGVALFSVSAIALAASSKLVRFHGSVCQAVSGTIGYSTYGVHNNGTVAGTSATVVCALSHSTTVSSGELLKSAKIVFYDRGTTRVTCSVQGIDPETGNAIWTVSAASPGGGPGTGPQFFNPSFPHTSAENTQVIAVCTIPATNAGWSSHITSISLSSSTP